jgi:hypothetical protein
MAGGEMLLSNATVSSAKEALRACAGWHSKAVLAHWDTLAVFDKLAAMLEQQQAPADAGSPGGGAAQPVLAAWTSATFRGDGRWWWMATGQPAAGAAMRWAPGYPADPAGKPYLMAVQEAPALWAVANVPPGISAYPLCTVAGGCRGEAAAAAGLWAPSCWAGLG